MYAYMGISKNLQFSKFGIYGFGAEDSKNQGSVLVSSPLELKNFEQLCGK